MSIVNTLEIYESLRQKFEDDRAKVITEVIEKSLEEYKNNQKEFLATKQDIGQLEVKVHQIRSELIKWMFIFWAGQIGILTGILFAFFR